MSITAGHLVCSAFRRRSLLDTSLCVVSQRPVVRMSSPLCQRLRSPETKRSAPTVRRAGTPADELASSLHSEERVRLSELSSKLSSKPNIDVTNIRAAARMLLRQTPLAEEANDASSGTLRRRSRSGGSVPADPMKGGKDMVTAARMAAAAIKALPSAPGVCDARVPPAIAVPDPALPTIVALPSIDSAPIVELPR